MTDQYFFITVEWCQNGRRGIFCRKDGYAFYRKDRPYTVAEMDEILGAFWLILDPKSEPIALEDMPKYHLWYPLDEYLGKYGIACKDKDAGA